MKPIETTWGRVDSGVGADHTAESTMTRETGWRDGLVGKGLLQKAGGTRPSVQAMQRWTVTMLHPMSSTSCPVHAHIVDTHT